MSIFQILENNAKKLKHTHANLSQLLLSHAENSPQRQQGMPSPMEEATGDNKSGRGGKNTGGNEAVSGSAGAALQKSQGENGEC